MKVFLCLLAVGMCLCLSQVNSEINLSFQLIEKAVNEAKVKVDQDYEFSRRESLARVKRNAASPADLLRLFKQPTGDMRSAVRSADYMEQAIRLIQEGLLHEHRIQKRSVNATDMISPKNMEAIAKMTGCSARLESPNCGTIPNVHKYRTTTKICNNRANPRRGSASTPFARWLPAEYQDGTSLPKGWDPELKVNGHLLPLVREVSNRILHTANSDVEADVEYTQMFAFYGQWIDHELTITPTSPSIRSFSTGMNCDQSCDNSEPCFPIKIPENDPRSGKFSCFHFFRSAAACGSGITDQIGSSSNMRQQINGLSAFLDMDQVYSSEDGKAKKLRDLSNNKGLMKVNPTITDNGRELLLFAAKRVNVCGNRARITNDANATEVPCFFAGDERSNENIQLSTMHTLMVREHNRLARELSKLNPEWDGETLYLEARKILGAYAQVIAIRDYVPKIVGPDFIAQNLSTYPGYSEDVDPSISNVFATAAFRFGHLTIYPFIVRLDEEYKENPRFPSVLLHKAFFTSWRMVFEGGLDPILRGLLGSNAKLNTQQHMMSDEMRDRLFLFTKFLSLDLASLNMQRGRDHGLPSYLKWRKFCGLSQPRTLEELAVVLNNTELATNLMQLYGTPENIDVWLGGVAEPFVPGGRVGPLFACLIGTQFQKIRQGDSLWWEKEGVFTAAQRESLRTVSLSRIICDNTGITDVPEKPFLYRPRGSGYTPCSQIPEFDLSPWKVDGSEKSDDPSEKGTTGQKGTSENLSVQSKGPTGLPLRGPRITRSLTEPPCELCHKSAFATRLGYDNPKPGLPIPFHEVIYNGQNHYDTETGIFTCMEPGVYEFEFYCTIFQNTGSVDLQRNGQRVLHSFTTKENGYVTATGGTLLQLKKGDQVWLSANYSGNGLIADSFFSGHMIFTL